MNKLYYWSQNVCKFLAFSLEFQKFFSIILLQQIVSHSSSKQFWKQNTRATLSYFWSVHVKKKLGSHPSSYNSLQCCILFEVAFKFLSPSFYSNFGNCNFIEILAPLCNVHPLSWHLYMMRNRSAFFSEVSVTTKFCHCQNKHQFLLAFSVWISPWFFLFSFWNYIANTHRSSRSEQIFKNYIRMNPILE